ncbi:hypothetical protein ILYODFUR_036624 [Ilyodon furcidens]|uniref:Uncharacterized protein n=1 Tax=Ilyodon furcidens TaxID=33524 RepID=A0ABV0TFH7_9TELE
MVPPAGGGPTGGWPRVSRSGLARPGPARSNPATRRSPPSPDPRPGSRVGPRLRRIGRHHVPRSTSLHEGSCYFTSYGNLVFPCFFKPNMIWADPSTMWDMF